MTPTARLLEQKTLLCLRAFAQTDDVNEAHFLVHGVMARALSGVGGVEPDLGLAMGDALAARAQRLSGVEVLA